MGDLIEAYDVAVRPITPASGVEMLRYLMQEHRLGQGDLPQIGVRSVVSAVLAGKPRLNLRQVQVLGARFSWPLDVFI